jgi:DNA adenine methylase
MTAARGTSRGRTVSAKPIVKWAGGKSKLVSRLLAHVPQKIGTYAEPFAGGAALFFAIASGIDGEGHKTKRTFAKAILTDQNAELVACYRAVKSDVDAVIVAMKKYKYDRDLFYETRDLDTESMSEVERAARLLFLNRTCYNGLWRVNASGKFNVPFGRYGKDLKICDEDKLRAASHALSRVTIKQGDFVKATARLGEGDFIYFDPPYVPLSKTAAFTSYARAGFGPADQRRLVEEVKALKKRGARVMLSNADTDETRALYEPFAMHVVSMRRSINSNAKKRGAARELIVTTWEKPGIYEES